MPGVEQSPGHCQTIRQAEDDVSSGDGKESLGVVDLKAFPALGRPMGSIARSVEFCPMSRPAGLAVRRSKVADSRRKFVGFLRHNK